MIRDVCQCGRKPVLRKYRDDMYSVAYSLKCDCGKVYRRAGIDPEEVKRILNEKWNKYYSKEQKP